MKSDVRSDPENNFRDDGIDVIVTLMRFHGIAVRPDEIKSRLSDGKASTSDLVRCAKSFGLKAGVYKTSWNKLAKVPMPAIAPLTNGRYLVVGKADGEQILAQFPNASQPELIRRDEFMAVWGGEILLLARRHRSTHIAGRFDVSWFLAAVKRYRWPLLDVVLISFFLQILSLISPLFLQVVVDKVLGQRSLSTLNVLIAGLVLAGLFETILTGIRTVLFAHTTSRIDVELGARLFRHLITLPIGYFHARRAGDSVARARELENIRSFLTGSAITLVMDLLFTVVFVAVMALYSVWLSLIVIVSLPVYAAISAAMTPVFRTLVDRKFERGAENQALLVETVTSVETIKAMAVEPHMQRCWEEQLASYVAASLRVVALGSGTSQIVQLVNKLTTAAILYFGARMVMDEQLSVGELVAFNMLAARVSAPVLRIAQTWQDFHQVRMSVERLGDILNTTPEPSYEAGRITLPAVAGRVVFEGVDFRYRIDGPKILEDVSFSAEPGEVIGVVGQSGSGKSTIAKLLQRLYLPENGRILIDDVDVAAVDPAWLRRQVGVVLQDSVLFNRSIRDNIALTDPSMSMDRVIAAAQLAGAHDFILGQPLGYDTIVGERGSGLSGGQRQRIAIARTLCAEPRILIFDEATSALDYESEREIQVNMRHIVRGRTVFIIAHRLSTLRVADRILTLDRGRLIETGTHDELLALEGRYASLHKLQEGQMSLGRTAA